MGFLTEGDKRRAQLMRELDCVLCYVGRTHPFHDNGSVNEPHVARFREENPVFDKDKDARDWEKAGRDG